MVRRLGESQLQPSGANEQILSLAGRDNVCSICADDRAADYKLASEQMTSGVVATLRLCDDCLNMRRNMYGENFVPFTNY